MDYSRTYFCAVAINCVTIVHLCLNPMNKHRDLKIFLMVVVLTIARLTTDIVFRHMQETYMVMLGMFLVMEFMLLNDVIRKMQKLTSSPPIVIFMLSLCMLLADISYSMHWIQKAKMAPALPDYETDDTTES